MLSLASVCIYKYEIIIFYNVKNRIDNETSRETNDSIHLFYIYIYIYIYMRWNVHTRSWNVQFRSNMRLLKWSQCFITLPLKYLNLHILYQTPPKIMWKICGVYFYIILQKISRKNECFHPSYVMKNSDNS
jgi:hypothetical protein